MVLLPITTTIYVGRPLNILGISTITLGTCILLGFIYKHMTEAEQKKDNGGESVVPALVENMNGGIGGKAIPISVLANKRRLKNNIGIEIK